MSITKQKANEMSSPARSRATNATTLLILSIAALQIIGMLHVSERNGDRLRQFPEDLSHWTGTIQETNRTDDGDGNGDGNDHRHPDGNERQKSMIRTRTNVTVVAKRNKDVIELKFLDKLDYFLSHIPKSGTEYATIELGHLFRATVPFADNRTAAIVSRAQKIFNDTIYGQFFDKNKDLDFENFPIDITGKTDAYTPPRVCNMGIQNIHLLVPYQVTLQGYKIRYHCAMHVTEHPWNDVAQNVYTIVREPFSHALSQYFHCTESKCHAKRKNKHGTSLTEIMPSLEKWLKPYVDLKEGNLTSEKASLRTGQLKERFRCYNPIDSESVFTQFAKFPEFDRLHNQEQRYTYPYPMTKEDSDKRNSETKQVDKMLFDDLKRRYNVIGDMSQMVKTISAIFIDFMQGKHIPEVCDCTHAVEEDGNNTGTFCLPDVQDPNRKPKSCSIQIGFDPSKYSHGVTHHGSSFLKEITAEQRDLIARLRDKDLVLFNVSRAVFDEQIEEMETRYGIKICERWNRPKDALMA